MMTFKRILGSFVAVVFLSSVTGACYNNYQLAPQELYKLNGFRKGQTVILNASDGGRAPFNAKTELKIDAQDGRSMQAKYSQIDINGTEMTGVVRGSGAPVNIDLGQVVNAQSRNLSVGKSVGLAVGLGVGIPVVVVTAIVVALAVAAVKSAGSFR